MDDDQSLPVVEQDYRVTSQQKCSVDRSTKMKSDRLFLGLREFRVSSASLEIPSMRSFQGKVSLGMCRLVLVHQVGIDSPSP